MSAAWPVRIQDIDRAGEAVREAERSRIHVFCATSKIHREHKLRKGEEVLKQARRPSRTRCSSRRRRVLAEDASRTELEFLEEMRARRDRGRGDDDQHAGHGRLRDARRVRRLLDSATSWPQRQATVVLSAHCHNDLGLAVANSLAAVEDGARQVECTINGIGERAGNASLEEIVMALRHARTSTTSARASTRRRCAARAGWSSTLTGLAVQPNKAIVGENAFAHESGIHQDGVLKDRETYEIMDPRRSASRRVLAGAGQALRPARAEVRARGAGLQGLRRGAGDRLHALQVARGQEEGGLGEDLEALVTDGSPAPRRRRTRSSGSTSRPRRAACCTPPSRSARRTTWSWRALPRW